MQPKDLVEAGLLVREVMLATDCDWAGPPEPNDGWLLKGEPTWASKPNDDEDTTDEEMPRLVRRELMDSSDEDSDDEPPPLIDKRLTDGIK